MKISAEIERKSLKKKMKGDKYCYPGMEELFLLHLMSLDFSESDAENNDVRAFLVMAFWWQETDNKKVISV